MSIDVELIQQSFAEAKPIMPKVVNHFYKTLFAKYPEVKPLFKKTNMEKQKKHLAAALAFAVASLKSPKKLNEVLLQLGEKHVGYGVKDEHYDAVGSVLLETLAHFFGDKWTEELEQNWTLVYQHVANTMKKGAKKMNRPKSNDNSVSIENISRSTARDLLIKAIKSELQGEIKKLAREQARLVLKQAIEEEAKSLLKVKTKTKAKKKA